MGHNILQLHDIANGSMSPHPKLHQCSMTSLCANCTNRDIYYIIIVVEIIQKMFIVTVQCVGELHIIIHTCML